MRMNFKWQPMIPNFHLKQHKGELTLPQTSQRKNVEGQKDLDDVREKPEWRSKKASGGRTLCLHSQSREGPRGPPPASGLRISCRVPLARLLFTIFPKWRACSQASLHSVMKQLNYQSALIGATNGNRPHSTRSAH